jgi:hypothetical protein
MFNSATPPGFVEFGQSIIPSLCSFTVRNEYFFAEVAAEYYKRAVDRGDDSAVLRRIGAHVDMPAK